MENSGGSSLRSGEGILSAMYLCSLPTEQREHSHPPRGDPFNEEEEREVRVDDY